MAKTIAAIDRHEHPMQPLVPMDGARCLAAACPPSPDGGHGLDRPAVCIAEGESYRPASALARKVWIWDRFR
jgi:hypothetical protein